MSVCKVCGRELEIDDNAFCPHCGAFAHEEMLHDIVLPKETKKSEERRSDLPDIRDDAPSAFSRYERITEREYFKYLWLMLIPLVGLFFALRKIRWGHRQTMRNFAEAMCIVHLVVWGTITVFLILI